MVGTLVTICTLYSKCMDDDQWQIFPGDPVGKKLGIKDRLPFNLFDGITCVSM